MSTNRTADVCIIGGGIVGSSIAYHLTEAGCTDVLVIEREKAQGLGSTGKATGGVRAQFSTPINIEMSLYSIDFLSHFEEATGHTSGYKPAGYLFLATDERQLDYLKKSSELQLAHGVNVEIVSREEISRRVPQLRADDILGGSFCQTDGFVSPPDIMLGFMRRALERGASLWLGTEVIGIEVEGGRVAGVRTTSGRISTRTVVNASGAWAGEVARLAGVNIPVTPLRRQLVSTKSFADLPENIPMVIDMSNGFHFRPDFKAGRVPGVLMAWPDPDETPGFKTEFDQDFVPKIFERAVARVPVLARAEVEPLRSRAGLYEVTPDHHAIIGEAPEVRGLFLANGFSGHGVMHSPATGRIVSEMILDGEARLMDVSSLGAERFAEGRLIEETSVL
ncbi:MAG: FAD-dependent oxidoreductase [Acidobacteria bacterium 13_1_20CM_3_53_8]|nr:MAG: FAD-dependent oxidoreductase [Acidobacteria bacterium 13_1_20CM_3_53_8]